MDIDQEPSVTLAQRLQPGLPPVMNDSFYIKISILVNQQQKGVFLYTILQ